jgi:hypothetical protein
MAVNVVGNVFWNKVTDVSEKPAASILKIEEWLDIA